jgi:hypothetical protein
MERALGDFAGRVLAGAMGRSSTRRQDLKAAVDR